VCQGFSLVRKRVERKLRKRLRCLRRTYPTLVFANLNRILLDPKAGWLIRGTAAQVLALADARGTVASLLNRFFTQTDKIELWETALTIEHFGDRAAVRPLIGALSDSNRDRRRAAARALGWIPRAGNRAAKALIQVLLDKSQPQPVCVEAAHSLAYSKCGQAIPALTSVLGEPDVEIRFWAVLALGGIGRSLRLKRGGYKWTPGVADPQLVNALERMLSNNEVPPGNWWSVGREALGRLGELEPKFEEELDLETQRVLLDPNSSPEDRRWAEGYSR